MIKRIFKETLIYAVAGLFSRFIGFLLVPIYTRVLSPAQFGLYDLLLNTAAILLLCSGLQVEAGMGRGYHEAGKDGSRKSLVGTGLILSLMGSLACWLLCLAGYAALPERWIKVEPLLLLLAVLSALPSQVLTLVQTVYRLENKPKAFLILSIGDVLLTSALTVGGLVYFSWGVRGVMGAILVSKIFWAVLGVAMMRNLFSLQFDRGQAKAVLFYSVPTVPSSVVGWVQNALGRYIIAGAMTFTEVGIYGLATRLASPVLMVLTAFRTAWYPYSMEIIGTPEFKAKCVRMLDVYWLIGFPVCAFIAALGSLANYFLSSADYQSAGALVGFFAMSTLWSGAQQILGLGIEYARKTYLGLVAHLVGALLNIVILVFAMKSWGLVGAGWAALISYIVSTMLLTSLAQGQYRIPYRHKITGFVGVCSLALSYWCSREVTSGVGLLPILHDAAQKILLAALMSGVLALMIVSMEDKTKLKTLLGSKLKKVGKS